jgi:serine/threonine protein kinase
MELTSLPRMQYDSERSHSLEAALTAGTAVLKVADVGLCTSALRHSRAPALPLDARSRGYIAPEVLRQHRLYQASDAFSFGAIMWELVQGGEALTCAPSRVASNLRPDCRHARHASAAVAGLTTSRPLAVPQCVGRHCSASIAA